MKLHRALPLAAVLLFVACGSDLAPTSQPTEAAPAPTTPTEPSASPFPDLKRGWTELPAPPEVRVTTATAWTGRELIVWGGYVYSGYSDEQAQADGFVYEPEAQRWRSLPDGPLEARAQPASAWTGTELLIWGGSPNTTFGSFVDDGAAYDPATETWRTLPQAPITARAPLSVWTGTEFIVWGTSIRLDEPLRDGAAYDPTTNEWRRIASAPIDLTDTTAAWTGHEMIVFGAALDHNNHAETDTSIASAYDPIADTWRRLPDSPLSPQASTAAWNGRELIAWDYVNDTAAYDPAGNNWRRLGNTPLDNYECVPRSVAVSGYFFGNYCGAMVVFDRTDETWRDVSRHEFLGWGFDLVAADPAVLLLGRNVDTKDEVMYAYRP